MTAPLTREADLILRLRARTLDSQVSWVEVPNCDDAFAWAGRHGDVVVRRAVPTGRHWLVLEVQGTEIFAVTGIEYEPALAELWALAAKSAGAVDRMIDRLLVQLEEA
jgi:hypothetical protein